MNFKRNLMTWQEFRNAYTKEVVYLGTAIAICILIVSALVS